MATQDGYSPYPIGLSAADSVTAIRRAHNLLDTLKSYCEIIPAESAPTYEDIENQCSYWYDTLNNKLYRAFVNEDTSAVVWFEE